MKYLKLYSFFSSLFIICNMIYHRIGEFDIDYYAETYNQETGISEFNLRFGSTLEILTILICSVSILLAIYFVIAKNIQHKFMKIALSLIPILLILLTFCVQLIYNKL